MNLIDDFTVTSKEFLVWFRQLRGVRLHDGLKIEDLRHRSAGRGVITNCSIPADTELFSIPRNAIITVENSTLVRDHPKFFEQFNFATAHEQSDNDEDNSGFQDPWLQLIVTMIYEYLQGHDSPWRPYLAVLPTQFDTLMFWNEDELQELQASDVRNKIGKNSADAMFRGVVVPLVRTFPSSLQTSLSDDQIMELAHRMGSIIMAYAFDLEIDEDGRPEDGDDGWIEDRDGQSLGMVPMADILNADAEFNAHLNHGEKVLTMISLRDIKAGEEILNYYGPLPRSDLLRKYGYTSSKYRVHDIVEISWISVLTVAKSFCGLSDADLVMPMAKLEESDEFEDSFVLEYQDTSPDDTGILPESLPKFNELPENMTAQIRRLFRYVKRIKPNFELDDTSFWEIVRRVLVRRLQEYSTSIEEDEALLQDLVSPDVDDQKRRRQYMAITVRIGEKQLLQQAVSFVEDKGDALNQTRGAPQAKRRRL